MGSALELVNLHGEESDLEFSGTNELINRFRVPGFPTGIVDARALIQNNTATTVANIAVAVAQEIQQVYPAKTDCSS